MPFGAFSSIIGCDSRRFRQKFPERWETLRQEYGAAVKKNRKRGYAVKWENHVRRVVPYTPGEQPAQKHLIKLNTNECPYPPSPAVKRALETLDPETLKLYPDPAAKQLVEGLAAHCGVKQEQIFVGVGSDDVLAMAFLTFFNGDKPILFPDVTYSFYDVWAELFHIPYETRALTEEFRIRKEDYLQENGGIIFPNPNAPTGVEEPLALVEEIVAGNPDVVVIVDEAYVDFGGRSALSLIDQYENLLVVQTFSKSRALAGMRIGFAAGSEKLIKYLNDVKFSFNSYTMSRAAIACGVASLEDQAYFEETVGKVIRTRERVKRELAALGFVFPDSRSNFIFATHPQIDAEELFEALREAGIYVRYFKKPRIEQFLRISIGTDAQMDRLLAFLRAYCSRNGGRNG